jgi:hypothetical protein
VRQAQPGSSTPASAALGPGAFVTLTDSTVLSNVLGLQAVSGGTIFSYQNNRLTGNVTDGAPSAVLALRSPDEGRRCNHHRPGPIRGCGRNTTADNFRVSSVTTTAINLEVAKETA